ncbi:MAG: dephospho-CoA kinase [Bdellovibrionota bacterium]
MQTKSNQAKVIGLTGNIGCGKSAVAKILATLGAAVVDADQVSREVTKTGTPLLRTLLAEFGPGIIDAETGELNRQALRGIVFADPKKRRRLESLLHPAIAKRSRERFEELFKSGAEVVIYEATLIVEAKRTAEFDGLLVITADSSTQMRRLMERDPGLTTQTAHQILSAQLPQSEKIKAATWVIENNGSLEELSSKVEQWWANVRSRSG